MYKIADMINGPFGDEFDTIEAAEVALAEAVSEGVASNMAYGLSGADADAKAFYCIVDTETGEEI